MVQSLLCRREDIFSAYTKEKFLNYVENRATIVNTATVSSSGRLLVWWQKRRTSEHHTETLKDTLQQAAPLDE
jgi:hypothetical protein